MPGSTQVSSEEQIIFAYGAVTLFGKVFQTFSANNSLSRVLDPTTPMEQAPSVWADPRSLATTCGMISFPAGT